MPIDELEKMYEECQHWLTGTGGLVPILRKYGSKCRRIVEFGTGGMTSTYGFLSSRPKELFTYDIGFQDTSNLERLAEERGIDFSFIQGDVLEASIDWTDLLFIDTWHTYTQLSAELEMHSSKVRKYVLLHDTATFGYKDEDGVNSKGEILKGTGPGLNKAVLEFLNNHKDWSIVEYIPESNGLTVMERKPEVSIIIPTCGAQGTLEESIPKLLAYTKFTNKQLVIVANGCPDGAKEILSQIPFAFDLIWEEEKIGYIEAVNRGISQSKAEFVILLDDDSMLLGQPIDEWVRLLLQPMEDSLVAITGPFAHSHGDFRVDIRSGCAAYRKSLFEKFGLFDTSYNPGYVGDTEIAFRYQYHGYKCVGTPEICTQEKSSEIMGIFLINFPVYHAPTSSTMSKFTSGKHLVEKNNLMMQAKYFPDDIEYSIIVPTYNHLEDCLKPCIESLLKYTDFSIGVEILVVANGCTDGTRTYIEEVQKKNPSVRLLWFDEPLGYTKATNCGIRASRGKRIVLCNNDVELLEQEKGFWHNYYGKFMEDNNCKVAGGLQLHDHNSGHDFLVFFFVVIDRKVFTTIGLLDEIFSPGAGEDTDFCIRAEAAGFKCLPVETHDPTKEDHERGLNIGWFPIYHKGEGTFEANSPKWRKILIRNGLINLKRYNKDIRLNLGSGGVEIPGYMSVDRIDTRSNILMDAEHLDFEENSISEIIASHLFEHLNPYKVEEILSHWFKLLKPGARLIMEMPNIEEICKAFLEGSYSDKFGLMNCIYGSVNTTAVGTPADITAPHLFGWCPEMIYPHLAGAGFIDITFGPEQIPHPCINFRVEARKPLNKE